MQTPDPTIVDALARLVAREGPDTLQLWLASERPWILEEYGALAIVCERRGHCLDCREWFVEVDTDGRIWRPMYRGSWSAGTVPLEPDELEAFRISDIPPDPTAPDIH